MTEAEWLACQNPQRMLFDTTGWSSRKLRLFAVSCCRSVEDWIERVYYSASDIADDLRSAIEIAERFADENASLSELQQSHRKLAYGGFTNWGGIDPHHGLWGGVNPFSCVVDPDIEMVCQTAEHAVELQYFFAFQPDYDEALYLQAKQLCVIERQVQADLLRDIFGNPFRPVMFSPEWRSFDVVALAQSMYTSRDFNPMPILADALEEAGCDSDDILSHCRGVGPHVRGCWVVDLVLGKS